MTDDTKEPTNKDRAAWAQTAVNAFIDEVGGDFTSAIGDLIADLCHLAEQEGLNPITEVRNGLSHYACERLDPHHGWKYEAQPQIEILVREHASGDPWEAWTPEFKELA